MKRYGLMKLVARSCLCILPIFLVIGLNGCNLNNVADLEPSGPIARSIDALFWITVALMSIILIPVFGMTAWIIWQYRASNSKAIYAPDWDSSVWLERLVWLFPALIIVILSSMSWVYTHRLDPYKPLASASPPLEIQVIALDWKWLFIYPEQNIAAVNELTIPVNRPVTFKITSNTVMNAFFIPRLGGQIFAMAGMETQLHLIADKSGHYFGENIQYSGQGFPYQNFTANATSLQEFNAWIDKAKQSSQQLDLNQFNELAKPSVRHPVTYYASVTPAMFKQVMAKFMSKQRTQGSPEPLLASPLEGVH
ncbi:MAG: ubiquinol oxidase subunit II [Methylovulum sp.]|nr:ubiquinol oxidase subunit II [Methylovulum sp.]